jgi:tripartite-type tricarboxylate transporter receptor subunit TctC
MWGSVATLLPFEQAGRIEMIANLSTRRLPMVPNMPTFTELGHPNAGASTHWMVVANSSADPETLQQIADLFRKIPQDHDLYTKTHILPESGSAESVLKKRIEQQREFAEIVRATKTKQ